MLDITCQCKHHNGICGAEDVAWYCPECHIYLAVSCGCADAHPNEYDDHELESWTA